MTGYELYKVAKKHLREGGSKARAYCGLPSGAAWCNAYVCYIANQGGVRKLFFNGAKYTYCPTSIRWCRANWAEVPMYLAMPMDVIYFDWDLNGNPNHIGFVKSRYTTDKIYTHEGNTNGSIVAEKIRPKKYVQGIFRPHLAPDEMPKTANTAVDGAFGYESIYHLQRALNVKADCVLGKGTVKALQKMAGCTVVDGHWGKATSKAVQRLIGLKGKNIDGVFGKESVKALQKWTNKQLITIDPDASAEPEVTPPETETPKKLSNGLTEKQELFAHTAAVLAWPCGTSSKKYSYKKGSATEAFKTAIGKAYPKRSEWSRAARLGASCDVFVGTCARNSVDKRFPRGLSDQSPYLAKSKNWKLVDKSKAQRGDIILMWHKGGGMHICIITGKYVAEAGFENKYGVICKRKSWSLNPKKQKKIKVYRYVGD